MSMHSASFNRAAYSTPHGGESPRVSSGGHREGPHEQGPPPDDDSEESIEAVENLLESYFMQIDSSYDRLVSIGIPTLFNFPERNLELWQDLRRTHDIELQPSMQSRPV